MQHSAHQYLTPASKGVSKAVFHTANDIQPWLESLTTSLECRVQGPTLVSLETLQMQESAERNQDHRAIDQAVERYDAARLAGSVSPDDTSLQVFILGEPTDENERNTLAAINTALISSALNDPSHTIAAFLPFGSKAGAAADPKPTDPQAPMAALRSLIQGFNVITFDNMNDLSQHLGSPVTA
jgi:hypothetical protein